MLVAALATAVSEKGPAAIKAPFNSGFKVDERPDCVELSIDVGKTRARVDVDLKGVRDATFSVRWRDEGDRHVPALRTAFREGRWNVRMVANEQGDLFEWVPGSVLELRIHDGAAQRPRSPSSAPPEVLDWIIYTENNPADSKSSTEQARRNKWIAGIIAFLAFFGGLVLVVIPEKKEVERTDRIGTAVIREIIGKLANAKDPKLAERGRQILSSILFDRMEAGLAIQTHGDWVDGMKAYLWARTHFVPLYGETVKDIQANFDDCVSRLGVAPTPKD